MSVKQKILFFDVETAPLLAHVWSQKPDFVPHGQIINDSFLLCWAAKWAGGRKILSSRLTKDEAVDQLDYRIADELAELVREADVVVAHNGDRFDIPVLNGRLLAFGADPIGPVRSIDTLKLARKAFRIASNRLDYLGRFLGVGEKIDTDFELWLKAYHGDQGALTYMERYCRNDVRMLERVYDRLKPYVRELPRLVDAGYEAETVCPFCGSNDLQRRGFHRTNASTFQRFQCQAEGCMRWSRSRVGEPERRLSLVPVS